MLLRKRPKIQMIWPSAMGKSEASWGHKNKSKKEGPKNHLPTRASRGSGPDQIAIGLLYASERSVTITSQKSFITPLISYSVKWDGFITPLISHSVPPSWFLGCSLHGRWGYLSSLVHRGFFTGYKIPQISHLTSARVSMRCHHICMGRKLRYWWVVWWALLRYPRISCPHGRSWPRWHL